MKNADQLVEQIENLVRAHVEATQESAVAALARAFGAVTSPPGAARKTPDTEPRQRASAGRRSAAELLALSERLCEAVLAEPGETMTRLAPKVGATPRDLARPMAMLRRAGRVRSVGQRHQTRYFPAITERPADGAS